jgi:hypothetical protein
MIRTAGIRGRQSRTCPLSCGYGQTVETTGLEPVAPACKVARAERPAHQGVRRSQASGDGNIRVSSSSGSGLSTGHRTPCRPTTPIGRRLFNLDLSHFRGGRVLPVLRRVANGRAGQSAGGPVLRPPCAPGWAASVRARRATRSPSLSVLGSPGPPPPSGPSRGRAGRVPASSPCKQSGRVGDASQAHRHRLSSRAHARGPQAAGRAPRPGRRPPRRSACRAASRTRWRPGSYSRRTHGSFRRPSVQAITPADKAYASSNMDRSLHRCGATPDASAVERIRGRSSAFVTEFPTTLVPSHALQVAMVCPPVRPGGRSAADKRIHVPQASRVSVVQRCPAQAL